VFAAIFTPYPKLYCFLKCFPAPFKLSLIKIGSVIFIQWLLKDEAKQTIFSVFDAFYFCKGKNAMQIRKKKYVR